MEEKILDGNLSVGDIFSEMGYFWVYIINIDGDGKIATLEVTENKCDIFSYNNFTEFNNKFSYATIPGHCISFIENDIDKVKVKFFQYKNQILGSSKDEIRDLIINEILI